FEDLVKEQGKYYCLEDMDKALPEGENRTFVKFSDMSAAGGIILIASFAFSVYEYWQEILFIGRYANKIGIMLFISNITPSYIIAIAGGFSALIMLIGAILVFARSGKGFGFGLAGALGSLSTMLYSFSIAVNTPDIIIAALSFVALVVLAYSTSLYEAEEVVSEFKETSAEGSEGEELAFPNVGRF
ncbi:MAG: hypothetical protein QXN59_02055, partial [Candidatus Micrarchaeaceae archaeon]